MVPARVRTQTRELPVTSKAKDARRVYLSFVDNQTLSFV